MTRWFAAGLLIGVATLLLLIDLEPSIHGAVFVAAFVVYAIVPTVSLEAPLRTAKSWRSLPATAAVVLVIGVAQLLQRQ